MSEAPGWALAVLALGLALSSTAGADPARGARVFQRCYACHSVVGGEDKLPGPNLSGVLERRAGTLPGFAFSPAMLAAGARGLTWTRATLDAFLADPQGLVPGTEMGMPAGLPAPDDRRDVIDYLAQTGAAGARPDAAAELARDDSARSGARGGCERGGGRGPASIGRAEGMRPRSTPGGAPCE